MVLVPTMAMLSLFECESWYMARSSTIEAICCVFRDSSGPFRSICVRQANASRRAVKQRRLRASLHLIFWVLVAALFGSLGQTALSQLPTPPPRQHHYANHHTFRKPLESSIDILRTAAASCTSPSKMVDAAAAPHAHNLPQLAQGGERNGGPHAPAPWATREGLNPRDR